MKLSELQTIAAEDLSIDNDNLDIAASQIPYNISRWLKFLNTEKLQHLIDDEKYKTIYRDRYNVYWLQHDRNLTKDEINKIFLPADEILNEAANKRHYTAQKMHYIESVIKTLQQMNFNISNMIKWKQFQHGR